MIHLLSTSIKLMIPTAFIRNSGFAAGSLNRFPLARLNLNLPQ